MPQSQKEKLINFCEIKLYLLLCNHRYENVEELFQNGSVSAKIMITKVLIQYLENSPRNIDSIYAFISNRYRNNKGNLFTKLIWDIIIQNSKYKREYHIV